MKKNGSKNQPCQILEPAHARTINDACKVYTMKKFKQTKRFITNKIQIWSRLTKEKKGKKFEWHWMRVSPIELMTVNDNQQSYNCLYEQQRASLQANQLGNREGSYLCLLHCLQSEGSHQNRLQSSWNQANKDQSDPPSKVNFTIPCQYHQA